MPIPQGVSGASVSSLDLDALEEAIRRRGVARAATSYDNSHIWQRVTDAQEEAALRITNRVLGKFHSPFRCLHCDSILENHFDNCDNDLCPTNDSHISVDATGFGVSDRSGNSRVIMGTNTFSVGINTTVSGSSNRLTANGVGDQIQEWIDDVENEMSQGLHGWVNGNPPIGSTVNTGGF